MDINALYNYGIDNIYENDMGSQLGFLDVVGAQLRQISVETLLKAQAFFVPNEDYMKYYFGAGIAQPDAGCYTLDGCIWDNYLVSPMYNVLEEIVGFVGFDPINYVQAKEAGSREGLHYYSYSSKYIMTKGNYLYGIKGEYKRALDVGYTCIVDGYFDGLSLHQNGFNAHSLLSSSISDKVIAQLRFLKKVVYISDNDRAGVELYKRLSVKLNNIVWVKQSKTKDIDALFKTEYANDFKDMLNKIIVSDVSNQFLVDFKHPKSFIKNI